MSKKYLVIGASSGIGKQSAEQLASQGFEVYGTYNKNETSSSNSSLEYYPLNVLDEHPNFDFLPDTLDGLVYCPGNISLRPFARIKSEDFMADFNLQVLGAIRCIQVLLPRLKNAESPSIVLFSTVAVQLGLGFHSQVAVSKGAIEGLTRALAAELAPKIRVNCIAPSLTDTPLAASLLSSEEKREANAQRHPLKKIGTTQDIANMVEFLVTDKSTWMSGQILHLDGGMSSLKV